MLQTASLNVIAAYMVAVSAVSLLIVQVFKTSILNRFTLDDTQRLAWIQLGNYVINLLLLLGVLAVSGGFDNAQFLFYLLAPLLQSGTSSTAFQVITTTQKATATAIPPEAAPPTAESAAP